jgi:putative ABC transport system permease protein
LGMTENVKAPLTDLINHQPGIESHKLIPVISSHLMRINGKTADQWSTDRRNRRYFQMEFMLSWSESIPPDTQILQGQWWRAPFDSPMISVEENAAQHLDIGVGNVLDFDIGGVPVRAKVANIRNSEFANPGTSNQFIFSPGVLDKFPTSYIGAVRIAPASLSDFQAALFREYPEITSIDVGQDKISIVIRFVALFAIVSGLIILAAGVVSTRYQRIREVVLLKTLGATRAQISSIQASEFFVIGTAAGLIGGLLAAIAAHYLLGKLLRTDFDFQWIPILVGAAATAALSIGTGWLASRGVLNHRPLEILREN